MSAETAPRFVLVQEERMLSAMRLHLGQEFPDASFVLATSLEEVTEQLSDNATVQTLAQKPTIAIIYGGLGAMLPEGRFVLAGDQASDVAKHIQGRFAQVTPEASLHLLETHVMPTEYNGWADAGRVDVFTGPSGQLKQTIRGILQGSPATA